MTAGEPGFEAGLFIVAAADAVVDAVDGLGEGSFGGVDVVSGEKALDLVAALHRAEAACGGYDADAGVGGELGVDLVPVLLDVIPGDVTGLWLAEKERKEDPGVLVADLAGGGIVERADDKNGGLETS